VEKRVWRDKKRRKRVSYQTLPFAGKPDKATIAAFEHFQLRNGLVRSGGILDAVTLELLGLAPMGPEIFQPLSGPICAVDAPEVPATQRCAVVMRDRWTPFGALRRQGPGSLMSLADRVLRQGPEAPDPAPHASDASRTSHDPDCATAAPGEAMVAEGSPESSS
jgi:hypothetical protein